MNSEPPKFCYTQFIMSREKIQGFDEKSGFAENFRKNDIV